MRGIFFSHCSLAMHASFLAPLAHTYTRVLRVFAWIRRCSCPYKTFEIGGISIQFIVSPSHQANAAVDHTGEKRRKKVEMKKQTNTFFLALSCCTQSFRRPRQKLFIQPPQQCLTCQIIESLITMRTIHGFVFWFFFFSFRIPSSSRTPHYIPHTHLPIDGADEGNFHAFIGARRARSPTHANICRLIYWWRPRAIA